MATDAELPDKIFADAASFETWIREGHDGQPGAWVHLAKKGSDKRTLSRVDAVLVALCWGWIDGKTMSVDDDYYRIRFQPRRPRSIWSQVNVAHVERLVAEGRMQPAGLAEVEAAKADGRWDAAYGTTATMTPPPELQQALDADEALRRAYDDRSASQRFAMCFRVHTAKRAETKARRVAAIVEALRSGEPLR